MNSLKIVIPCTAGILFFSAVVPAQRSQIDRPPAVAGQFYPAGRTELTAALKQLVVKAVPSRNIPHVLALIAPHAGYVYSGEVAASAFNQLDAAQEYENIFVLGSSHHIGFEGASVYSRGNFITPLGTVKVNTVLAKQLISKSPVFSDRTDAHAQEHSLEVQLPFLQYILKKDFRIIPIVLGTQSPETCRQIAEALRPYLNPKNLFIISTDFSHYPSALDAHNVDRFTADAILTNSSQNLLRSMADCEKKNIPLLATPLCGWTSVLTLLFMTEGNSDVTYTHIQYKNSGDSEYGEKNRVVGYHALAVSLKQKKDRPGFRLSDQDKKELLLIARNTVEQYVKNHQRPKIEENKLSGTLRTNCGAFVTLKKHGDLRGCIGRFDANDPLFTVVQEMAIASSTQDYRFSPVEPGEIPELEIEISVLTPMKKITSLEELELGIHGIYIRKGAHTGTFLPQVASETGWTKEEFLGHCARDKAGIGWNGWKDAELYVYEALVFNERDFERKP
jgi:MEMO1 family protein